MVFKRNTRVISFRRTARGAEVIPMLCLFLLLPALLRAVAQQPAAAQQTAPRRPAADDTIHSTYILGPDDQISIHVLDAEEISDKPVRIDMSGHIRLPMLGRLRAAGLTLMQLEEEIATRLTAFIKDPDVAVSILEFGASRFR